MNSVVTSDISFYNNCLAVVPQSKNYVSGLYMFNTELSGLVLHKMEMKET